jgi:uncharacterized protein (DUF2252 family)
MLVSPFAFFRGAALIMAADLADTPSSGLVAQLCGDAHLSNFGAFGTPERRLLFDVNDFDETLPGPWEWDVKRLAASIEVMGRDRGFSRADRRDLVLSAMREYRERMRAAAGMRTLDVWYAELGVEHLLEKVRAEASQKRLSKKEAKTAERHAAEALTRDSLRVLARRAGTVDGELRIRADPPLIVPVEELVVPGTEWERTEATARKLVRSYRRTLSQHHHPMEEFSYAHLARKVVGVGSVGTRCWILLFTGRDEEDPLFLQVKEAQPSVLERFVGPSAFANHGQRVVEGQRLMQAASDLFLGWLRATGLDGLTRDYYVRQLHDWKGGAGVDALRVPGATLYGRFCAATLARAHARSGDRIAIASYLGKGDSFDRAIADFAVRYADQNERDYEALAAAVTSGRVEARTGL